ncbi:MAG: nucleotidyltransferase [Clostridia bacterium]|nr:nucleotidyltransferase [Clostridia bacterium]
MKVLGLIVEYNPFHNGHLYHLQESKKLSGADCVICVMSGNFIQRGEPSIVNKWARARMALCSGADLVIELPFPYAMSSAEYFAFGAVKILDSLGIVNYVCFGSEHGSIDDLKDIAQVFVDEPHEYRSALQNELNKGLSFPAARENALTRYLSCKKSPVSFSSNNILGIEYLKALIKLKSDITPLTIARVGNTYNQEQLSGEISSATAIRKHIDREIKEIKPLPFSLQLPAIPQESSAILEEEFKSGRGPVFSYHFELLILSMLRKMKASDLKQLPFVSEGLENRIKEASGNTGSLNELLESISTKRYTRTRIQRILFNTLTGMTQKLFDDFNNNGGPQYIRVLGFNQKGRTLLSLMSKSACLPVIIKAADFKNSCNPLLGKMLELEALATDLYVLGYSNPQYRKAGQEFTQNLVIEKY